MKVKIYVLCYNEKTLQHAKLEYEKYEWAQILLIKSSLLFENIMYDSWLLDNYDEWKDLDYVGTISWKATQKIKLPNIDKVINYMKNNDYGIAVLNYLSNNMIEFANYFHTKFKSLWINIFTKYGINNDTIINTDYIGFYSNYWITTPKLMLEYINFFKDIIKIIDNNDEIQKDIWCNSNYLKASLTKDECYKLFKKPYYPYHPFIYERLPCFFFYFKTKILITQLNETLYS